MRRCVGLVRIMKLTWLDAYSCLDSISVVSKYAEMNAIVHDKVVDVVHGQHASKNVFDLFFLCIKMSSLFVPSHRPWRCLSLGT